MKEGMRENRRECVRDGESNEEKGLRKREQERETESARALACERETEQHNYCSKTYNEEQQRILNVD